MISKYLLGSAITASLLLVGCGSGSTDTTTSSADTTTVSSATGYVVDAAVQNMDYDCVSDNDMNKVTGTDGAFTCKNMDQVRFRIGEMVLGEIHALPQDKYVFPQDILGTARNNITDTKVTAMAQLLQSLDENNDLNDGIQIAENTKDLLAEGGTTFNPEDMDQYMESISIDPDKKRTPTEAQEHLRTTMQKLNVYQNQNGNSGQADSLIDINSYPLSTLTQELKNAIAYMGNEERLAYDIYINLYNYHNSNGIQINQLQNIANNSEVKHIGIVQSIVKKYNLGADDLSNVTDPVANSNVTLDAMPSGQYDIPAIQDLYDTLYKKGINSAQDALEVGCMVEVTDIDDLNKYIGLAEGSNATDIIDAFNILRNGSYNHYWAFDKGLKNKGVTAGCCSLGTDYCHPEYPQNENGGSGDNGSSRGNH